MRKLLLFFILMGCTKSTTNVQPPIDSSYCDAAQAQLLELKCTEWPDGGPLIGGPNASGVSYGDRCRTAQANNIPMKPQCISTATTCDQVNTCLQGN